MQMFSNKFFEAGYIQVKHDTEIPKRVCLLHHPPTQAMKLSCLRWKLIHPIFQVHSLPNFPLN